MTPRLLTRASDGTETPDYAAWLGRAGVAAEWIGPQDPRPDSASAYGALLLTDGDDAPTRARAFAPLLGTGPHGLDLPAPPTQVQPSP